MKKILIAAFISPLSVLMTAPIYAFYLSSYYSENSTISFESVIPIAYISAIAALIAGYILTFTYGLVVYFFFKKFKLNSLINYLIAGCLPGILYGLFGGLRPWVESFLPGILFGLTVAFTFWYILNKKNA